MPALVLASRSPRRRQLLDEAGVAHEARPADLDDGDLTDSGSDPTQWVAALAYLKARRVADSAAGRAVLGADTVVIKDGAVIGQPRDAAHAREIILALREGEHRVATGVALLRPGAPRLLFVDVARVRVGAVPDAEIDAYLASDAWRGKAGAYNLNERQDAGWPLTCEGDPATVMGLPMRRLRALLAKLSLTPAIADTEAS